ncbi:hypothetical protein [Modestobacter sp. I12A-02662]|uniref:hypothetical protein n=1 Tax=Modestobacter sp. I12A-02662 TaxID=1730496 RepID=UPI0034DE61F3
MHRWDLAGVLRRTDTDEPDGAVLPQPLPTDALEWSWPPYAPVEGEPFPEDDEWAPASVVWHPAVRLGRWTVVYRRSAC